MKKYNEDEETENISDKSNDSIEQRGFQKVPIGETQNNSIEIFNVYNVDYSKSKFKKKIYKIILIILAIVIVFALFKILNISQMFAEEDNFQNNNMEERDPDEGFKGDDDEDYDDDTPNTSEHFYVLQKKEKIDLNKFNSPQLKNPKNIKLVNKLEISIDLEYENYIHFKIRDADNKRWEVPEKDILDNEYYTNRIDNSISLDKTTPLFESKSFTIELILNNTNANYSNNDNNIYNFEHDLPPDFDPDDEEGDEKKKAKKINVENETSDYFGFKLLTQDKKEFFSFSTLNNFLYSDTFINFESKLSSNKIYGLGERVHDFELKEGTYTIWPQDPGEAKYDDGKGGMNQYGHHPIALHKAKYSNLWIGLVLINSNDQDVVISSNNSDTFLTYRTIGGIIDYYIIVNDSPEDVIKNIQTLFGIPPVPPYWSLGFHQCRYGYKSFDDFKTVYEKYKSSEIPLDAMWLDIDALDNFNMFTINDKFKDIIPYITNELQRDGGKFVPIVDMAFSYEDLENKYIKLGNELDIFIKSNYTKENYLGKVWSKKTVFPDFLHQNISDFWNMGLTDYYNMTNYDGIWLDMNEPTNLLDNSNCNGEYADESDCTKDKNIYNMEDLPYIPGNREDKKKEKLSSLSITENAFVSDNNTIYNIKPLLAYYQEKETYNFLKTNLKKKPFILSRSTMLGAGKYTYHWLGDNLSNYPNLKNSISGIFNFGLFGIPMTGADICGFMGDSNRDLCIRWHSIGAFYPFSRNHNFFQAKDQYPWSFDNKTKILIKKSINLRYSLIRYMYSQFYLIGLNEKGSFFKPLMIEFPEDPASYEDIEGKIMIGEALMLCAFYEENQNSKKFKFPNSHFNEYPSGKSVNNYREDLSNNEIELSGDLEKIHLFLRGGFILPYQNVFDKYIQNTLKLRDEKINFIVNIDNMKQSKAELFFDNDEVDSIDNNYFYRVDVYYNEKKLTFNTFSHNLDSYNYNDHILGKIEFWRAKEMLEVNNFNENVKVKVTDNEYKEIGNFEANYDSENDKLVYDFSEKMFSIFNITSIEFI